MTARKLLIAGGGTGGHIFPGIAVAEEWRRRAGDVVFVGTPHGQEGLLVPRHGFGVKLINVGSLKGAGFMRKLRTIAGLPGALRASRGILRREKPDVVLGIGGYASGPLCLMAALQGVRTAITEQNVLPGMTNRMLGRFVKKIFVSFGDSVRFFPTRKTVVTGNPVRAEISFKPYEPPRGELRVFVFGGSQGAAAINAAFTAALDLVKDLWPKLNIVHQASRVDLGTLQDFYATRGLSASVQAFFDDMNAIYQKAHVVICRSGAGTVTELAIAGRPAVFVPYPFATDDHQTANARAAVAVGGGLMIGQKSLTPETFATILRGCVARPEELARMAEDMRKLAKPEAAKEIVDQLMEC